MSETNEVDDGNDVANTNENVDADKSSPSNNLDVDTNNENETSSSSDESTAADDRQRELDSGYRIITEIVRQNKTTCWPFMDAVDAEGLGLWDYHQKIKEPMWLNKIIEKFDDNSYSCFAEFARDFRIMVENCYRYNTTEHPISKKAKRLEMMFEGKLALLRRDIRESATIAKTSNGRFAVINESNSTMRSGRVIVPCNGSHREADAERQTRLVYDFVRCEEAALAEDERLTSHREHKQQQTLYQQVAAAFVSSLETPENMRLIKSCHLLPEIGLFLHLTESTLRLPPLAMYNLEMSLLIPSDSLYLAKIMTSFLCTYFERSLISQRPPMLFKTWENRLRQRLEKWFELVLKHNSYHHAADKLLIGLDFFQAMNWKNPFIGGEGKTKSFLDFTYHEKAIIVKALCDNLTTFQSIQNNISSLPCEQSRAMSLGYDVDGNEYTYFPQFCGDDVRIYRHRRYGENPSFDPPDALTVLGKQKELLQIHTRAASPVSDSNTTNLVSDSNVPDPVSDFNVALISTEIENNELKDTKICGENDFKKFTSESVENGEKNKKDAKEEPIGDAVSSPELLHKLDQDQITTESASGEKTDVPVNTDNENGYSTAANNGSAEAAVVDPVQNNTIAESTATKSDDEKWSETPDATLLAQSRKIIENAVSKHSKSFIAASKASEDVENSYDSSDAQWAPKTPKKKSKKTNDISSSSPLRRSSRKRAKVSYTSLLASNEADPLASDAGDQYQPPVKKRPKRGPRSKSRKPKVKVVKVEEPDEEYGCIDFELVCYNLESLRTLIAAQEDEHEKAVKEGKSKTVIRNVCELLERLKWLLGELDSYETHLEKARFDAKIMLKREHDEIFRAATTGRAIQSSSPDVDPWEDELISKNTMLQGDGSSIYTPPASIYYEDSDEESDRELRRSKRRPKRYESDEDFVLDSGDETPHQTPSFLYDEYDEERQRLLPAALAELEARLQKQATSLQKMMGGGCITRQNEFGDVGQLIINERRTRQRSKKENKVFRKVLVLAMKEKEEFGPYLLPLIRSDQTEIGEIVERVLANEEVARQQRKLEREEEQKRKRAQKLEMQRKNKEAQASRRAAKRVVQKYKADRHETKLEDPNAKSSGTLPSSVTTSSASMWSPPKKQTVPVVTPPSRRGKNVLPTGKAENVMVRLQNGKIGQALRFPDGRVVPIMRMDDAKALTSTSLPDDQRKQRAFHPHISLSGHRTSILRRNSHMPRPAPTAPSTSALHPTSSTATASYVAKSMPQTSHVIVSSSSKSLVTATTSSTVSSPRVVAQSPAFKSTLPASAVSQRLTLPSGQVINLLVKHSLPAANAATKSASAATPVQQPQEKSLGRMFVDDITSILEPSDAPTTQVNPQTSVAQSATKMLSNKDESPLTVKHQSAVIHINQAQNSARKQSAPIPINHLQLASNPKFNQKVLSNSTCSKNVVIHQQRSLPTSKQQNKSITVPPDISPQKLPSVNQQQYIRAVNKHRLMVANQQQQMAAVNQQQHVTFNQNITPVNQQPNGTAVNPQLSTSAANQLIAQQQIMTPVSQQSNVTAVTHQQSITDNPNLASVSQQSSILSVVSSGSMKQLTKPLGIVSPMMAKQPTVASTTAQRVHDKLQYVVSSSGGSYVPASRHQQPGYILSPTSRYVEVRNPVSSNEQATSLPASNSQQLQLGMQNVALVTQPVYQQAAAPSVQLVPTLMAGSVPLVQPVQFVQTVPIQVNAPVMFVAPSQPHLQAHSNNEVTTQALQTSTNTTFQSSASTNQ